MKKLISTVIMILAVATLGHAQSSVNLSAGYREKGIAFGKVFDEKGAYVFGADAKWNSFHFAADVENHGSINGLEFYRSQLLAGYKFFSTLVDVEAGTEYEVYNHPGKYDFKGGHFQPYVTASKGPISVTAQMDLEAKLSNIEGHLSKGFKVASLTVTPDLFIGYTDCNDWLPKLPKTIKKIKFNDAYYGAELKASYKMAYVGVVALHNGANGKTTTGFELGLTHKL